ncbi:MAG: hypothetical protein WCO81_02880 [Cyanobacteriota bacterium ELA615]|jgi:hypothetical protein
MYSIDLILRDTPLPISVQRKEKVDAESLYQAIKGNLDSDSRELLELTCEKEEDKKIAILTERIVAVSLSKKTGGSARTPGFFALNQGSQE